MQKRELIALLLCCTPSLLHGWSSESNQNSNAKPSVNFTGTIVTTQKDVMDVSYITLDGKFRGIALYDAPVEHEPAIKNSESGILEIVLKQEPQKNLPVTKMDMQDIATIEVKQEPIWIYQESKTRKASFVELIITSKNNTKNNYLIREDAKVYCQEETLSKTVPIGAINTLTIKDMKLPENESSQSTKQKQNEAKTNPRKKQN